MTILGEPWRLEMMYYNHSEYNVQRIRRLHMKYNVSSGIKGLTLLLVPLLAYIAVQ